MTLMLGIFTVHQDKPLGGGGFGIVYHGENTKTKEKVAIKQISVANDTHGMLGLREIKHYEALGVHPHIVRMYDYHFHSQAFWIVMELCTHGDLNAYFKKNSPGIDFIVQVIHESISAISYMHNLDTPIVHRDIKPDNILLTEQTGKIVVRLTDFGISKIAEDQGIPMMTSMIGTPPFMAPELFVQPSYDERVDIFSLGLVLLAMLNYQKVDTMLMPKTDSGIGTGGSSVAADMIFKFKGGKLKETLMEISTNDSEKIKFAKRLVNKMTQYKPEDRMPLTQALQELETITGRHISLLTLPLTKERTILMSNEITPKKSLEQEAKSSTHFGESRSNELVFKLLNDAIKDREKSKKKDTFDLGVLATAAAEDYKHKGKEILADSVDKKIKQKIEPGDFVLVINEKEKVKQLQGQRNKGGWVEPMANALGKPGEVRQVDHNRGVARVEVAGKKWIFHIEAITLIAKAEERMQSILK